MIDFKSDISDVIRQSETLQFKKAPNQINIVSKYNKLVTFEANYFICVVIEVLISSAMDSNKEITVLRC